MGELNWDIDARAFSRWRDLDATGIDLGDARLAAAAFSDVRLTRAVLRRVDLERGSFVRVDLSGSDAEGARMAGLQFVDCDLTAARLVGADLRGARLTRVRLCGADLRDADLTGAITSVTSFLGTDLRNVKGLTQKQVDVACSDKATLLPPGFTPHFCQ
jgi:uncharacterized protein YjbI with pentapeptide repeats